LQAIPLSWLDYAIIFGYFAIILIIGYTVRKRMVSSHEFFMEGRSLPVPITGIAFVAASSGALEIMGMVSTSSSYGARANSFYWIGPIPAIFLLALFMMPIYYLSRGLWLFWILVPIFEGIGEGIGIGKADISTFVFWAYVLGCIGVSYVISIRQERNSAAPRNSTISQHDQPLRRARRGLRSAHSSRRVELQHIRLSEARFDSFITVPTANGH